MIYDVVITVNTDKTGKDKQRTISVRVEADNISDAKLAAFIELRRIGVSKYPRSGFSVREAK